MSAKRHSPFLNSDSKESISNKWLSTYLYYDGSLDEFLINAIDPFVKKIMKEKIAERFFFIRYWENGAHIRLRFWGKEEVLETQLKPLIVEDFTTYFKNHPLMAADKVSIENERFIMDKRPSHTIYFTEYEPEVERYGGAYGLPVSEAHFESSSVAALKAIQECPIWNYEQALGVAIQIHLCFAYATNMSMTEAQLFYADVFEKWFSRAYLSVDDIYDKALLAKRQMTLDTFEKNFQAQKKFLIPFHTTVWDALISKTQFEEEWMNTFVNETLLMSKEIENLQQEGKFYIDPNFQTKHDVEINVTNKNRWYLYGSYVHMTNNRLGLLNRDEPFVGYLIKRSLESINENNITANHTL